MDLKHIKHVIKEMLKKKKKHFIHLTLSKRKQTLMCYKKKAHQRHTTLLAMSCQFDIP